MSAADLDADGDIDVAVSTGDKVKVRLNQGAGTLGTASSYNVGSQAVDLVAADWDGDQDLDLFTANYGSDSVSALRRGFGGNYGPAESYAAGSQPNAIAAADFDADGRLDLAVVNYGASTLSVLLGTGPSTFAAPAAYALSGSGYELEIADLDGDGWLDIATANVFGTGLSVLRGLGNGTFAAQAVYGPTTSAFDIEALDFDRDGDLDLALSTGEYAGSGDFSYVHWNQGGLFTSWTRIVLGSTPTGLSAGDFDGDLGVDLAVACPFSHRMYFLGCTNLGVLSVSSTLFVGDTPWRSAVADLDRDGLPDLVVTLFGALIGVFDGRGDGTFGGPREFDAENAPERILSGDFTGDGVLDFAVQGAYGPVQLLRGLGAGEFAAPVELYTAGQHVKDAAAGDLDGDLDLDLVVVRSSTAPYTVLFNDGSGGFGTTATNTGTVYANCATLGDLDGDQDLDLVTAYGSSVAVRLNQGGGVFAPESLFPVQATSLLVELGDLDGDLDLDLAVGAWDTLCVLLNNGSGVLGASTAILIPGYVHDLVMRDLDGDLDLDLVAAQGGYAKMSIVLGNGDGTFAPVVTLSDPRQPVALAVDDLDANGVVDLVSGNTDKTLSVRLGVGNGIFEVPKLLPIAHPSDLVLVDCDGDLDLDLVTSSGTLMIHPNTLIEAPWIYCHAKTNSSGCTPGLSFAGAPSASSAAPFWINASNLRNNKAGLLFYGLRANSVAFQGGTLCIGAPLQRTPVQLSGGNPLPADDCSGVLAFDFNARIQSGLDPQLVVGAEIDAQHWSRDPAAPSTTGLTDAIHFRIQQ